MLADRLKELREARSWSQGHLADAARLNIRTVQRIEAGEPASPETLLSLAAALDVSLSELEPDRPMWAARGRMSHSRIAFAILLISPAALFIIVNLLRSAGIGGPFDLFARLGGKLVSFHAFNLVSPVVFLGGAALALVLCLPTLVRLRSTKVGPAAVSINGMELRAERGALLIAAVALVSAGLLLTYAAMEFLGTAAS